MSHELMQGMFWASVLLSGIPIAVFIAGGVWLARRYLAERNGPPGPESKEAVP